MAEQAQQNSGNSDTGMNGSGASNSASGAGGSSGSSPLNIDWNQLIARTRSILTDPIGIWDSIAAEGSNITSIYKSYIIILAALGPIATFLNHVFTGKSPLVSGLVFMILSYATSLVMIFLLALVVNFLAPKFDGADNLLSSFKLVAYAQTAAWVGGLLQLFGSVIGMLSILFAIYGAYTFWQGIPKMTGVPEARRPAYFLVLIVVTVVLFFVLGLLMAPFAIAAVAPMHTPS